VVGQIFTLFDIGHLFLGPKLEFICMISVFSSTGGFSFIESVTTPCLSLRSLIIDHKVLVQFPLAITDLILGRVGLESFRVGKLTSKILTHITTSKLQRLEVENLIAGDVSPISGSGLTQITDLPLRTWENVNTFDQFLSLCRPYQLQHLSLKIRGRSHGRNGSSVF
jgi:hypothetical protein